MREGGRDSSFLHGSSDKQFILLKLSSALRSGEETSHPFRGTCSSTGESVMAHRKQLLRLLFLLRAERCWSSQETSTMPHSLACWPQVLKKFYGWSKNRALYRRSLPSGSQCEKSFTVSYLIYQLELCFSPNLDQLNGISKLSCWTLLSSLRWLYFHKVSHTFDHCPRWLLSFLVQFLLVSSRDWF